MSWADTLGLPRFLEMLKKCEALGTRYQPTEQVRQLAAANRGFYGQALERRGGSMNPSSHLLCVLFLILALPSRAPAWVRFLLEDTAVVKRAEVIVVGRLKPGSIVHVPEVKRYRTGSEHHATLLVTEVVKGKWEGDNIPIIIHYGLTPVIGGRDKQEGRKQVIAIHDTGSSGVSPEPVVKDATQEHLWFLRKSNGPLEGEFVAEKLGIVDPDDVQPRDLKAYFAALLAPDPEAAMQALRKGGDASAKAAECHLDLLDIRRIVKLPDVELRAQILLPYYAKLNPFREGNWPYRSGEVLVFRESERGLVSCGSAAVPLLRELLDDQRFKHRRQDILRLCEEANQAEPAPPQPKTRSSSLLGVVLMTVLVALTLGIWWAKPRLISAPGIQQNH